MYTAVVKDPFKEFDRVDTFLHFLSTWDCLNNRQTYRRMDMYSCIINWGMATSFANIKKVIVMIITFGYMR